MLNTEFPADYLKTAEEIMNNSQVIQDCIFKDTIPIGFIAWEVLKDKWDNMLSVVHLCDTTYRYNIVHHSKPFHREQRSTLYGGRGKFVKITENKPRNDCEAKYVTIGGITVSWGDGDNLGVDIGEEVQIPPEIKDSLRKTLRNIDEDNVEAVLVLVLSTCRHYDTFWTYKEVGAKK